MHPIRVKITGDHAITRGMADYDAEDELWHTMEVNGDINVLATAHSPREYNGSGKDEPVAFTTEYGKGRCFNFVLGAFDYTMKSSPQLRTFLLRGSEWAAAGGGE